MKTKNTGRGGARKGAGRKAKEDTEKRKSFSARLSPATHAQIDVLRARWKCSKGRAVEQAVAKAIG